MTQTIAFFFLVFLLGPFFYIDFSFKEKAGECVSSREAQELRIKTLV